MADGQNGEATALALYLVEKEQKREKEPAPTLNHMEEATHALDQAHKLNLVTLWQSALVCINLKILTKYDILIIHKVLLISLYFSS